MPRDGRIIDIRYYGRAQPVVDRALEKLAAAAWVGDRICRKLRQYDFRLGRRDQVHIHLVPDPPTHELRVELPSEDICRILYQVDPADLVDVSVEASEAMLADITIRALRAIAPEELPEQVPLLEQAQRELGEHGRDLGVEYYRKETRDYVAVVNHRLHPMKPGPLKPIRPPHTYFATLEFTDKATGRSGSRVILDFNLTDELHSAVGAVTVKNRTVFVKPRPGHNFGTPIEIPIDELLRS